VLAAREHPASSDRAHGSLSAVTSNPGHGLGPLSHQTQDTFGDTAPIPLGQRLCHAASEACASVATRATGLIIASV